jgi:hypothetical protein
MNEMGGENSMYGGEVHTGVWWRNLRERDHLEDPGIDGRIIRLIFMKWDGGPWIGLFWFRIGTGSRLSSTQL